MMNEFEDKVNVISVYGSYQASPESDDYARAQLLGAKLAQAGFVVATGGYGGTMEAVSKGASLAGGQVIGVTSLRIEQFRNAKPNRWITKKINYDTLWERQLHLVRNNQGIVVLPGGIGTLAEFTLAWSLVQVNEIPARPIILIGDMWPETLKVFIRDQYVAKQHQSLLSFAGEPGQAVTLLEEHLITRS